MGKKKPSDGKFVKFGLFRLYFSDSVSFSSTSSSWDLLPKAVCHRDFQHFWPMFSQCDRMKQ